MPGTWKWWGLDILAEYSQAYPNLAGAGKVALISALLWVIISITLHELAHGWVAIKCGDDTPRLLGHMTLDPLKHMGIYGLVVFAVIGWAWGSMPVNVANLRRKHDDALVALAGPLTNVLLAVVCFLGLALSAKLLTGDAYEYAKIVFFIGLSKNVVLTIFNLLPVPPLDGSRVVASFIPQMQSFVYSQGGYMLGLIFVFTVAGRIIWPMHAWVMGQAAMLLRQLGCL